MIKFDFQAFFRLKILKNIFNLRKKWRESEVNIKAYAFKQVKTTNPTPFQESG